MTAPLMDREKAGLLNMPFPSGEELLLERMATHIENTEQSAMVESLLLSPFISLVLGILLYIALVGIIRRGFEVIPGLVILLTALLCTNNVKNYTIQTFTEEFSLTIGNQKIVLVAIGLLIIWNVMFYSSKPKSKFLELGYLSLFSLLATQVIVLTQDLIITFLALELQAFTLYIFAGISRKDHNVGEASLKYFTLSAIASITFALGIGLVYAATGISNIVSIGSLIEGGHGNFEPRLALGIIFVCVSLIAKIGLIPFHSWFVDLYTAIPNSFVWLAAITPKIPYLFLLSTFFSLYRQGWEDGLLPKMLIGAIIASVVVSAAGALTQTNMKRFVAYSIIFNNAFLTSLVLVVNSLPFSVLIAFVIMYSCILATVYTVLELHLQRTTMIKDLLVWRGNNTMAYGLAFSLLALIGLPPFSFFIIKFYLLLTLTNSGYILLATALTIASIVAAYYYLRVVKLVSFSGEVETTNKIGKLYVSKSHGYIIAATILSNLIILAYPASTVMILTGLI
jgi:NADH-quinone oxidoreductase subunit N